MRKLLATIIIALFLTTSTFGMAFAAEEESTSSTAGITPDSILYPIDKLIEQIHLFLTANDVDKALILTESARERLAEAQVMMDEGKTTLAEDAVNGYADAIEQTNDLIQDTVEQQDGTTGQDQTADDESQDETSIDETAEDTQAEDDGSEAAEDSESQDGAEDENLQSETDSVLDELLAKNLELQKKSVDVLAGLLEKLPEQSRDALTAVIVKQIMRTEAVRDFVDTKKAYNDGRKDVKDAEKVLKAAEKSEDQAGIDEAKLSLEEANKKLDELAAAKDEASRVKKNINTMIDEKLAEINKSNDAEAEGEDDEEETAQVTEAVNEIEKKVDKVKNEIMEQQKVKNKGEVKENKEQVKEQEQEAKKGNPDSKSKGESQSKDNSEKGKK